MAMLPAASAVLLPYLTKLQVSKPQFRT